MCANAQRVGSAGGKYICGFDILSRSSSDAAGCVAYSFGNNSAWLEDFERALASRTACNVHLFDPSARAIKDMDSRVAKYGATFHPFGLGGGREELSTKRLLTIMRELGHRHVDVLRLDVGGGELQGLAEAIKGCPGSFTHLVLEIHWPTSELSPGRTILRVLKMLEECGYVLFHKQPNYRRTDRNANVELAFTRGPSCGADDAVGMTRAAGIALEQRHELQMKVRHLKNKNSHNTDPRMFWAYYEPDATCTSMRRAGGFSADGLYFCKSPGNGEWVILVGRWLGKVASHFRNLGANATEHATVPVKEFVQGRKGENDGALLAIRTGSDQFQENQRAVKEIGAALARSCALIPFEELSIELHWNTRSRMSEQAMESIHALFDAASKCGYRIYHKEPNIRDGPGFTTVTYSLARAGLVGLPQPRIPSASKEGGYIVVHYTGSGLNNQVMQLLNGMFLARQSARALCLMPFVRRRSEKGRGEPFERFERYMNVIGYASSATTEECASACGKAIGHMFTMVGAQPPTDAQHDALRIRKDAGFTRSKGVESMRSSGALTHLGDQAWGRWGAARWRQEFARPAVASSRCVELYVPFPLMDSLEADKTELMRVMNGLAFSAAVRRTADRVVLQLFGRDRYAAVHWRHEWQANGESKCRTGSLPREGNGKLCFVHLGCRGKPSPLNIGSSSGCTRKLRMISPRDMVDKIRDRTTLKSKNEQESSGQLTNAAPLRRSFAAINRQHGGVRGKLDLVPRIEYVHAEARNAYLATDCPDASLLERVAASARLLTLRNCSAGRRLLEAQSSMMVSFVEQQICIKASAFIGTSYSTWTAVVALFRGELRPPLLDEIGSPEKMAGRSRSQPKKPPRVSKLGWLASAKLRVGQLARFLIAM